MACRVCATPAGEAGRGHGARGQARKLRVDGWRELRQECGGRSHQGVAVTDESRRGDKAAMGRDGVGGGDEPFEGVERPPVALAQQHDAEQEADLGILRSKPRRPFRPMSRRGEVARREGALPAFPGIDGEIEGLWPRTRPVIAEKPFGPGRRP